MLEIADEIILDFQVALVDRRDERQVVHVLDDGARRVVADRAIGVAIGQPGDGAEFPAFGDFPDGEIEFVAGDEIDRGRAFEARLRLDRDLGADEADFQVRIRRLERRGDADVGGKRRRRGVQHREIVRAGVAHDVGEAEPVRHGIDQL